jgi:hypothetical protein
MRSKPAWRVIRSLDASHAPNFFPKTMTLTATVTSQVPNPSGVFLSTSKSFKILYRDSALTIGMSTTCQSIQQVGARCNIQAALGVLPGTPT